jgi:hypothetical protein
MRLLVSLLLAAGVAAAEGPFYSVVSGSPGAWPEVLESIGMRAGTEASARVLVAGPGTAGPAGLAGRVEKGALLILEGESPLAESFGFAPTLERVQVEAVTDSFAPTIRIVWEKGVQVALFSLPSGARVFAKDRWSETPLVAGIQRGEGAVLWLATGPGERGYSRFPYLTQALASLGLEQPFRSARLWAFFDSSYRLRVDVEYFARRWRMAGISALHVAAWHYYEADPGRDAYLEKLIAACHREGIQVYAWIELPHVSEKFWDEHPEWREQTAVLQDAQLDWRKLMNLANRDCFRAVSEGVRGLLGRFSWDGVNLAELYFESLEGAANPSRFTPMNRDVRAEFKALKGFDPVEIFATRTDAASLRAFLDYRRGLARRIEEEWIEEVERARKSKPDLGLVLTHVDDRFDATMRDAIGADAASILPFAGRHDFTFLIEDPATVWDLGPQRYPAIAGHYREITPLGGRLAVDINIADRYQQVYPTKQQTGSELYALVHSAAGSFPRVALYFESSLSPVDLTLLSSAGAAVSRFEQGAKTTVDSPHGVGIPWKGGALVDGKLWPCGDGETLWLPAGAHTVEHSRAQPAMRMEWLNADLGPAAALAEGLEFSYASEARALAVLDQAPGRIEVDGHPYAAEMAGERTLFLPRGRHSVTIRKR